jgi:uncharacterized protein (DUF736 family)
MSDSEEEAPKTKKAKGTKRKKDKNAPKRPLSSFMYFSTAKRSEFAQANPQADFKMLGKIIGAAWKELSDADKKPYEKLNAKDKERYESEKANYTGGGGDDDDGDDDGGGKKKKATKKQKKDKDAPKSAPSAYVLFCNKERPKLKAKHPDAKFGELGTLLGAAWKALDTDAKEPFNVEHAKMKKVQDAKKKEYEEANGKPEKKAKKTKKAKKGSDDEGEDDAGSDDE